MPSRDKHDALIRHLEAERDDLVDSPGDGHPERVAEIKAQLKSLGVDPKAAKRGG